MIAKQQFLCISCDYVHMWSAHQPRIICVHLQDDVIDFMEFVAAVHLVLRGNLEDRLKWSFKVYDRDDSGKLDKQEVKRIIRVRVVLILTIVIFEFPCLKSVLLFPSRSFVNLRKTALTWHPVKFVTGYSNFWMKTKMVSGFFPSSNKYLKTLCG